MSTTEYKFTADSLFLFVNIFETNSEEITKAVVQYFSPKKEGEKNDKENYTRLAAVINAFTKGLRKSRGDCHRLLAIALKTSDGKISQMDAYEYLEHMNGFLNSLDWARILGEIKEGSLDLMEQITAALKESGILEEEKPEEEDSEAQETEEKSL